MDFQKGNESVCYQNEGSSIDFNQDLEMNPHKFVFVFVCVVLVLATIFLLCLLFGTKGLAQIIKERL